MSAPQSPGDSGDSSQATDSGQHLLESHLLSLMTGALFGAGNGEYSGTLEAIDDYDDDDDDDYHDAEEALENEYDEQEDGVEDDEDNEDDDDDIGVDEGRPIPYLTRRQANMLLRGETLHNGVSATFHNISVLDWNVLDDDDDNEDMHNYIRHHRPAENRFPKVPSPAGQKLMTGGLFGTKERPTTTLICSPSSPYEVLAFWSRPMPIRLLDRELGYAGTMADRRLNKKLIAQSMIPTTKADMIVRYDAPVYLGQFSDDGNFFYSATKDFHVRMYDTANVNEWKHYKTVEHPLGRWTLTDASLSPDNRWLAFTSMMPRVCLAPTNPNDEGEPYLLDLGLDSRTGRHESFAIFSVRFSGDGRELVAGTSECSIVVYDIESRTVLHSIDGHAHDVNAVCFGDKSSPHLIYSGSDDATIKVWDRRSLGDGRPAGAFVGHCEGVTYIDSKGDGRYILSNGKDQTMRLWDLRMAMSTEDFDRKDPAQRTRYSLYDYRFQRYNDSMYFKHPDDNSVVTFRGHRVERTLIRCHFSPPGSSDGSYVYSASHGGQVVIWNLDATVAGTIYVRRATQDTLAEAAGEGTRDGSDSMPFRRRRSRLYADGPICIRDASWHPNAPVLVASGFDADTMQMGTCSLHSSALSQDGDSGGREHRLYDEKMRPISGEHAAWRGRPW